MVVWLRGFGAPVTTSWPCAMHGGASAIAPSSKGARRERRALVTEDKGFGELVVRRGFSVPGLLLVRYAQSDVRAVLARLLSMIDRHGERFHHLYAVIMPARTRLRRLDAPRAARP
jgi:hypothetical protein